MTELVNTEIPRDRFGRPMIMPPKGGKRVAYRRCTTFVGCLEDTYNLQSWKTRQVAIGMGQRPDLVLAAASADKDDKRAFNEIAEKATEHALASASATTGTALHALTERVDRGQKLGHVPDPYGDDIKAYERATAGIEWLGIEAFRVHDGWKVAGTADRIGRNEHGRLRIYDIKTGSIDYPHKMAMQLAMYARSLPYDIATDKRGDAEEGLDLSTGIIIHLPAGEGRCDLYEINIAKGWGACVIAKQVWDWRGTKDLTHLIGDERVSTWEKAGGPSVFGPTAWLQLVELASSVEQLRQLWTEARDHDALTDDFRAAAQKRSEQLRNTR
jgi:hypothetical protein